MPKKTPPFIRFTEGYKINNKTGCWLWMKSKYKNGYGWLKVFGRITSAHRFAYELYKGKIPSEMQILHSCDTKHCVNPDHLRVGTHAENMKEASQRKLMRSGKNHHLFGKKNPRPKQANKVIVLGVKYESQKSAERALGLGSGTVRYWITHCPEKATLINEAQKPTRGVIR